MRDFVHLMYLKYNIGADVSVINQNVLINTVKCLLSILSDTILSGSIKKS